MAARAESEAVRKIPIPITKPITIMVMSNKLKRGFFIPVMFERYKIYLRREDALIDCLFPQLVENKSATKAKFNTSSQCIRLKIPLGKFIKREVRFDSGAIPVAVNTWLLYAAHFFNNTTVHTGRSRNEVKPEDLPGANFITSFREKSRRCINCISSYSFLFRSEGS